jgi:hypothetical protein
MPSSIHDGNGSETTLLIHALIETIGELGTEDAIPEPTMGGRRKGIQRKWGHRRRGRRGTTKRGKRTTGTQTNKTRSNCDKRESREKTRRTDREAIAASEHIKLEN